MLQTIVNAYMHYIVHVSMYLSIFVMFSSLMACTLVAKQADIYIQPHRKTVGWERERQRERERERETGRRETRERQTEKEVMNVAEEKTR